MTCRKICIVIALMVLSISAILVANPGILGGFSSTLNGVPVQVAISLQGNGTITTMRTEDLLENWADSNERFVRFTGTVKSVTSFDTGSDRLEIYVGAEAEVQVFVYPLDAPHLPMEYQEQHVYEFTGFFVNTSEEDELDRALGREDAALLRVYAFEIRHHGEGEVDTSGITIK